MSRLAELADELTPLEKQLLLSECDGWGSWMFEAGEFLVGKGLGRKESGSIYFDTPLAKDMIDHLRTLCQGRKEMSLIKRLRERAEILDNEWDKTPVFMDEISNDYLEAATQLQAYEVEIERLTKLISAENIEHLATDIAIACVDCRQEIREARHRAMVRLGERLRKPLSRDLERIARASLDNSKAGGE